MLLVSEPSVAHADKCTWEGGCSDGSWHDPANESCGFVPDGDDTAIVEDGTVNVNGDVSVLNLIRTGGVLQGTHDVTVVGVFRWSGRMQTGAGRTTVDVRASWYQEGNVTLDGWTAENRGSAFWNAGTITVKVAGMWTTTPRASNHASPCTMRGKPQYSSIGSLVI